MKLMSFHLNQLQFKSSPLWPQTLNFSFCTYKLLYKWGIYKVKLTHKRQKSSNNICSWTHSNLWYCFYEIHEIGELLVEHYLKKKTDSDRCAMFKTIASHICYDDYYPKSQKISSIGEILESLVTIGGIVKRCNFCRK